MCRIRIKGSLFIHNTVPLPLNIKGMSMYLIATRTGETADRICTYILHIGGFTNSSILRRFLSQWNSLLVNGTLWLNAVFSAQRSLNPSIAQVKLAIARPVRILRAFLSCRMENKYAQNWVLNCCIAFHFVNVKVVKKTWRNSCCYISRVLFHYVK